MPHIFISYRKKDRAICLDMQARLETAGYTVWWDDQLRPGKEWAPVIEEQLRKADAVIVIWTRNATRSKWVYFEAMMAAGMHKLVMLSIGNLGEPAGRLAGQNFYSFDPAWSTTSQEWQHILERIEQAIVDGVFLTDPAKSFDDVTWSLIRRSSDVEDFTDYLSRYPDGPHSDEARARRDVCRGVAWRRALLWWVVGTALYLLSITPSRMLIRDFGWSNSLFFANLYFPMFGFSVLFGAMMVPIYCFTLAKALRFSWYCREHSWRARSIGLVVLIGAPILTSFIATYMEVSDGYAPWQFRQIVLQTPLRQLAQSVPSRIAEVPGGDINNDSRTLQAVFELTRDVSLSSLWDQRNRPLTADRCLAAPAGAASNSAADDRTCLTHMNNLQSVMEAVRAEDGTSSATGIAYKYCFFFSSLLFLGSYFNIFYIGQRAAQLRAWLARLSPWSGQRFSQLLILLAVQLLMIAFWFISRLIFQLETATILPSSGGLQFSQSIRNSYFLFVAVYLIAAGFLLQATLRVNSVQTRVIIVGAALITTTLFGLSFFATIFIRSLQNFIGVHATSASTIVMAVIMVFVIFVPFVMPNLLDQTEPDLRPQVTPEEDP